MLLRLTSVRELSLFRILSRVSSTLVGFGGSSGKTLKGSGFTTPECDKITQLRLQREKGWNQIVTFNFYPCQVVEWGIALTVDALGVGDCPCGAQSVVVLLVAH